MTALPNHKMTADEFLIWLDSQPQDSSKLELIDGVVMQQHRERLVHSEIKAAAFAALRAAIQVAGVPCRALVDGPVVRVRSNKVYKPDGLVYCGPRLPDDVTEINTPTILIEVISKRTAEVDFGDKLEGYFSLASVQHYVILDPLRKCASLHSRGTGDALATRIQQRDQALRLDPPGIEIALTDVFERE
jgi:Uma2 family endonuclease